jgi:hypothetical protein
MNPRFQATRIPLTPAEREEWKAKHIAEAEEELRLAKEEEPPMYCTKYKIVKPGEPGYEDAEFQQDTVFGFKFLIPNLSL